MASRLRSTLDWQGLANLDTALIVDIQKSHVLSVLDIEDGMYGFRSLAEYTTANIRRLRRMNASPEDQRRWQSYGDHLQRSQECIEERANRMVNELQLTDSHRCVIARLEWGLANHIVPEEASPYELLDTIRLLTFHTLRGPQEYVSRLLIQASLLPLPVHAFGDHAAWIRADDAVARANEDPDFRRHTISAILQYLLHRATIDRPWHGVRGLTTLTNGRARQLPAPTYDALRYPEDGYDEE